MWAVDYGVLSLTGFRTPDVLASVYEPRQVVIGVTYSSGTVLDLAKVAHPGVGPTYVGPFAGDATEGAERLAEALRHGDLEAHVASPIRPEIWKKLILNAATLPTAALTGMKAGALTAHGPMHDLVSETARLRFAGLRSAIEATRSADGGRISTPFAGAGSIATAAAAEPSERSR